MSLVEAVLCAVAASLAAADARDRPRYRTGKAPFIEELPRRVPDV